jgi:hypothetical protein
MIWAWFEEDDLLSEIFGKARLHTDSEYYFLDEDYWHLLIRRLSLEAQKWFRDTHENTTCIIEFSRGKSHGGYQAAYQHLSDAILASAAALYLNISFQESLRKNRARFNPDRPDSILEHALNDDKLNRLYCDDDWFTFSAEDPAFLSVRNHKLPYVIFENEDDVTTEGGDPLGRRLEKTLGTLWGLWSEHHGRS